MRGIDGVREETPRAESGAAGNLAKAKIKPAASKDLFRLARRAAAPLALAVAAPLVAGLLIAPQAWLTAGLIQRAVGEGAAVSALLPAAAAIVALTAFRAGLVGLGEFSGGAAAARLVASLRQSAFRETLAQPPHLAAAHPSGALSGAIVEQVEALEPFFARYLPAAALATALPLAFALAAALVDPVVGALFLVTAPLIPVFMALVGFGAAAAHARHQQAVLRLSGFFADRLRGLTTLKLLGRAEAEAMRLREAGDALQAHTLGVLRIAFLSSASLEFFAALGVAGVALYVGLSYLGLLHLRAAPLSLQGGLFCLMMAPEVYLPLRQFSAAYHDRAGAVAAAEQLAAMFGEMPGAETAPKAADAPRLLPEGALSVSVASLDLTTPAGERPILSRADFVVAAGARVALLGASGAGKSAFLETLARLRFGEGRIAFSDAALADIPEAELRARVAVLGQRPRLFKGTIADNIRLGRANASDAEVRDAAERAGVLRFADALPEGLATPVGEDGLGLSGGEAHRVALARLYLRDPGLVLLDEPTAHLDPETETAVIDGLLAFAAGRTLIVATHSEALAARMDRVALVAGGKILPTLGRWRAAPPAVQRGAA